MTLLIDPNNSDNVLVYIPSDIKMNIIKNGFSKISRSNPAQCWISLKFALRKMREIPELGRWVIVASVPKTSIKPNDEDLSTRFLVNKIKPSDLVSIYNNKGVKIWSNPELTGTDEITTSGNLGSFPNNIFAWGRAEDYEGNLTSFKDDKEPLAGMDQVDNIIKSPITQPKKKENLMDSRNISKVIRSITQVLESGRKRCVPETNVNKMSEDIDLSTVESFKPEAEAVVVNLVKGLNTAFSKKRGLSGNRAVVKRGVTAVGDTTMTASIEVKSPTGQKRIFNVQAIKDSHWNWLWKVTTNKEVISGRYDLQITSRNSSNIYKIIQIIAELCQKATSAEILTKVN
jgi:hypothetical protein